MTFKVCYWDEAEGVQKERDSTPEEDAQREIDIVSANNPPVEAYVSAVQSLLDKTAQERLYDNILSACTYASSPNPKFSAEGQACLKWRDEVWSECYKLLDEVQSGKEPKPTIEQVLSQLPKLVWPN